MNLEAWFIWALVSMACYGVQSFLNVHLVRNGGDGLTAQVISPAVVSVAALLAVDWKGEVWGAEASFYVPLFALLQGLFYFWTTWSRLDALRQGIPSGIVFPLLKTSTLLVVILSAWILEEWGSLLAHPGRLIGIALSLVATAILIRPDRLSRVSLAVPAIVLIATGIMASAGASLMAKGAYNIAADFDLFAFILLSNLVNLVIATGRLYFGKRCPNWEAYRVGLTGGFLIGLFNFLGLVAFMSALKEGDLAVVASINALYILIPILLGWGFYHEEMSVRKHLAIALTVVAMVFLSSCEIVPNGNGLGYNPEACMAGSAPRQSATGGG